MRRPPESEAFTDMTSDSGGVPSTIADGVAIPSWAERVQLSARLSSGGGASTVPVTWYGRLRLDGGWVPIPTCAVANVDSQANDLWLIDMPIAAFDAVAPYVTGSSGTFNLKLTATFTEG